MITRKFCLLTKHLSSAKTRSGRIRTDRIGGHAHTDKHTDKQTDRQIDRQTDRLTDRQINRQTDRFSSGSELEDLTDVVFCYRSRTQETKTLRRSTNMQWKSQTYEFKVSLHEILILFPILKQKTTSCVFPWSIMSFFTSVCNVYVCKHVCV